MTLLASYVPGTMKTMNDEDAEAIFSPFYSFIFLFSSSCIYYYLLVYLNHLISTSLESIALQIPVVVSIERHFFSDDTVRTL